MFSLVRFETPFVMECALARLSRQGYVAFEPGECEAGLPDFCIWVEDAGCEWLLSWARDHRVLCVIIDTNF